jgi:glycine cleavage system H protein
VDFPDDLLYSAEHLWVKELGQGLVRVGITDFAQDQLGRVVFVDLPAVGQAIKAGGETGAVESAKSVSDLISPVDGQVTAVNSDLADEPAPINDDPYGAGWLAEIRLAGALPQVLLKVEQYRQMVS